MVTKEFDFKTSNSKAFPCLFSVKIFRFCEHVCITRRNSYHFPATFRSVSGLSKTLNQCEMFLVKISRDTEFLPVDLGQQHCLRDPSMLRHESYHRFLVV